MTDPRIHRFSTTPGADVSAWTVLTLAVRAAAERLIGTGEDPGRNNLGPGVDRLRQISGVGRIGKPGAWCGVGCSAVVVLGASDASQLVPFELSAGASALSRNAAEAGYYLIPRQPWYRFGRYKGVIDAAMMQRALFMVWRRGGPDPKDRWKSHIEVPDGTYDPATDTVRTYAPNVVPKGSDLRALQAQGIEVRKGQALWHHRTHRLGSWRKRLLCLVALGEGS